MVELLAAAAVIARLFRIGGQSETGIKNQKIAFAASKAQFLHLLIVSLVDEGHSDDYPYSHYRIVNTRTKLCYYVPSILESLVEEEGIFNEITLKNETKWNIYLKDNRIRDEKKFPTMEELGIWMNDNSVQKEGALYRDYIL